MLDFLAHRARISPRHPALLWRGRAWTYAQMHAEVSGLAAQLAAAGIGRGAHVAVLMSNRPEYVFLIHALARLAAVLVPLNLRLTPSELRWQADHADCTAVVCDRAREAAGLQLLPRARLPGSVPAEPEDSTAPTKKGDFYERRLIFSVDTPTQPGVRGLIASPPAPGWRAGPFHLDRTQAIVFTSGTTGHPKGARLTFANHFWSATASAYRLGHRGDDRWLLAMPLYHVGGMAIVLRCCMYGTTVVLHEKFDPDQVNRSLDEDGVTIVSLVPTMLRRVLATRQGGAPRSLRCALVGGAAAPRDLLAEARARGFPVALTYGLTEAASQVATARPEETARKPGSAGKALMFTELRIAKMEGAAQMGSAEQMEAAAQMGAAAPMEKAGQMGAAAQIANSPGQQPPVERAASSPGEPEAAPFVEAAPNEIGEIIVRGPTVMRGYYRARTAGFYAGHWLRTGDLGYLDEDGDLWVVQRRTDLIVTGGENVYPSEVERALLEHPNVRAACVVGLPDPEWGQRVAAAVVWQGEAVPNREAVLEAFLRRGLAGYKIPRQIRFVTALPRTASGKVRRQAVRKLF